MAQWVRRGARFLEPFRDEGQTYQDALLHLLRLHGGSSFRASKAVGVTHEAVKRLVRQWGLWPEVNRIRVEAAMMFVLPPWTGAGGMGDIAQEEGR